ncbi:MAG: hypothetical protein EHM12_11380 [Dehalococcoidia bacterium]|nr:MAG: hypothetical protein EHM12_11380 [Dehalococcoidia bacterium]
MSTTYLAVTNDTERQLANVEAVTGATTLTAEDSGKVFILKAAAGAQITLPAVATSAGLRFKFIVGLAFATTDWTVKAATNVIEGSVLVNGAHVAGVDENTISFVASAESIGDFAELVCDGTNWYVNGSGVSAGAITLTAV